jgi:hypothetical protein
MEILARLGGFANLPENSKRHSHGEARDHGPAARYGIGAAQIPANINDFLAERAGFEPALGINLNTLSRRATSTAHPPLRFAAMAPGRFSDLLAAY